MPWLHPKWVCEASRTGTLLRIQSEHHVDCESSSAAQDGAAGEYGFMTVNDPIEVAGRQKIQPQCAIVALRDAGEIA